MANHSDPKSFVTHREVWSEVLAGEIGRPAIELRNHESGMSTESTNAEGRNKHGVNRKSCIISTQSETLSMSGSDLRRSWEISAVPGVVYPGGTAKVIDRKSVIDALEKSDTPVKPKKPSNMGEPAEVVEERGVANGNAGKPPVGRTPRFRIVAASLVRRNGSGLTSWRRRNRQWKRLPCAR